MTVVYRIVTRHTEQVLKDFIRFTYRVRHPRAGFQLWMMGIGFVVLAIFLPGEILPRILCGAIGALLILFACTRHLIAFSKLAAGDRLYQEQKMIELEFGQAEFTINEHEGEGLRHIKYSEINKLYVDKRNYYLLLHNEELQVLPFADMTDGEGKQFEEFIHYKTGEECKHLDLPLRERIVAINRERKRIEQEHDKRIQEKKKK